jgi:hypothetical protein
MVSYENPPDLKIPGTDQEFCMMTRAAMMQNIYADFMALCRQLVEVDEQVCQLRPIAILAWQLPLRHTERKVRKDSKWADLGTPGRVIDTLVQNQIEPEWLGEVSGPDVPSVHDSSLAPTLHTVSRADALRNLRRG